MPTDPNSASQTPNPAPLGQAQSNPEPLPQHPSRQPHQVPAHLRFQQQPLHQIPHHQQPQHLPPQQYAPGVATRNMAHMQHQQLHQQQHQQQQHHMPQPQQPQQLQQGQPIPRQPQRNHLTHQQQPPPQQYFPVSTVNGAYAIPGYAPVAAQYNMNPNFMYNPPFPYNGMQQTNSSQQPTRQTPRGPRQFPSGVQPSGPSQSHPRVTIPTSRKKTILAIVDPDTNEEVQVSNVDAKPATSVPSTSASAPAVKIPSRTSRPLELVSDPADKSGSGKSPGKIGNTSEDIHQASVSSSKDVQMPKPALEVKSSVVTGTSDQHISENKEEPVSVLDKTVTGTSRASVIMAKPSRRGDIKLHVANAGGASPVVEALTEERPRPSEVANRAFASASLSVSSPAPSVNPAQTVFIPSEAAHLVGVAESRTMAPILMDQEASSADVEKAMGKDIVSGVEAEASSDTQSMVLAAGTNATRAELNIEQTANSNGLNTKDPIPTSEEDSSSTKATVTSSKNPLSEFNTVKNTPAAEGSTADLDTVDSLESPVVDATATPKRERLVFRNGERRVYPPAFFLSLRSYADPKKSSEYVNSLVTNNIQKQDSSTSSNTRNGDPRGTRSMKANDGPLSKDPRGKGTLPAALGPGFMGPARGSAPHTLAGGGVGSYDAFDLSSARSQNPPPAPKGQQNLSRDPRGTRPGGSGRDRFDGPTRYGHGPIDPFVNVGPVEKLKRSEKGWKRDRESDDEIATKVKQIRSLLNKLTLEKFEKIFKQIVDIDISSYELLIGVVKEVFEKALFEPKFSGMYAELCTRLDVSSRDMLQKADIKDANGKPIYFRNILLNNCKEEFTRFAATSEGAEGTTDTAVVEKTECEDVASDKEMTEEERKLKERVDKEMAARNATKAKQRMLANVMFIGELYLKDLLKEHVIHRQCIQRLLTIAIAKKEEDVLEALCKLISKTGAKLSSNKKAITHIDGYFKPLQMMSMDHTLPARVRFMLQDLLEQRSNNWKVRREEAGAKTIKEIHQDIEKEERVKAEAQAAARDRRRGGGSMHGRDRGPQNFPPRVAMTMASRQKSGSGVSRSTAILEKHANRSSSNPSTNYSQMNLRPKAMAGRPAAAGNTRQHGSRYNALANLNEPRESGSFQSSDVRRTGAKKWQSSSRKTATSNSEPVDESSMLMDREKLKKKTKSILREYWATEDLKEAKEEIKLEVMSPNYAKLVEEAIKMSLEAKTADREKSLPFFYGIIGDLVPGTYFVAAFTAVIEQLSDIEVDSPRAAECLGQFIGAIAATKKLGEAKSPIYGLEFLKTSIDEKTDLKRGTKLIVVIMGELYKAFVKISPDKRQCNERVMKVLTDLEFDMAARMVAFNEDRSLSALEDMLKDQGISFMFPVLLVEFRFKELLAGSSVPVASEVEEAFKVTGVPLDDMRSEAFMRMVLKVSFEWLFKSPPKSIKDTFAKVVGSPLVHVYGSQIARDVQMAAVLETQSFVIKNLDRLPAHKEGDTDKPGYIAFECLYDADIVEEDTFLKWKEDTELSAEVGGKEKMMIQTSGFFRWLECAVEEE